MSGCFEKPISLKGHVRVAVIGASTLQRDQLMLDQRLDICAIEFTRFRTVFVVDEEQDSKLMGTQHGGLHLIDLG
ncbi:hypothetical protein RSP799_16460 [Ralstonia solanacearum]|nr:hypothetical protein RSP799_16460 [Ralstonia solanacearum]